MGYKRYLKPAALLLASMAIACCPVSAWGGSFNTFPPVLMGLTDIAVSKEGKIFALRQAPFPFKQVWVFDRNGKFLELWGQAPKNGKGAKPSDIKKPASIAVNSRGRVYIVNSGIEKRKKRWRISIFEHEPEGYKFSRHLYHLGRMQFGGNLRITIGADDALIAIDRFPKGISQLAIADGDGQIRRLRDYREFVLVDVAADDAGNIYAIDAKGGQIVQFDSSGSLVGQPQGRFELPVSLAMGQGGSLYVVDKKAFKLHRLGEGGKVELASWGGKGRSPQEFFDPVAVAAQADRVYVADDGSIKVFSEAGRFIHQIGGGARAGSFLEPRGICRDGEGNIFVADAKLGRVQKFDEDGDWLFNFGAGVLKRPILVAASDDGKLFVVDQDLMKLWAFLPDGGSTAWDLPETFDIYQTVDLRVAPGGESVLLLERESALWGGRLWEMDVRSGQFQEVPSISALGRLAVGLAEDGTVFVEDVQGTGLDLFDLSGKLWRSLPGIIGMGDAGQIRPPSVTIAEDTIYVVDHPGPSSRILRFDRDGGLPNKQWQAWGLSPELPCGQIVGLLVNPDGSLIISDAFWGTVLHLSEDAQGRLVPAGAIEHAWPQRVAKRPRARRDEPIPEVLAQEVPVLKPMRYYLIALALVSVLLAIGIWWRWRRR